MSLGTFWDAASSAALIVVVFPVSIMQTGDGARVSTPAGTISQHIWVPQINTKIQVAMPFWALMSSQHVGKCQ